MIKWSPKTNSYEYETGDYPAKWDRDIDGDTVSLMVDKGMRGYQREDFRIIGINADELRDKDEHKRARALSAKNMLHHIVTMRNTEWPLRIVVRKGKSFDRWLADIFFMSDDGKEISVAAELLNSGLVDVLKV
jgi:endonuclease YncB( thermonuclease family)